MPLKTQIITADDFANLYADMLGIVRSSGLRYGAISGTHPVHGFISFMTLDPISGDGALVHHDPEARYERRPGELTPAERDELEEMQADPANAHLEPHALAMLARIKSAKQAA